MLVVHVHIRVKPEFVDQFKQATVENARHSVKEPGIARFDVLQQQEDPTRFVLVEAYRTPEAPAAHRKPGIIKCGGMPSRPGWPNRVRA